MLESSFAYRFFCRYTDCNENSLPRATEIKSCTRFSRVSLCPLFSWLVFCPLCAQKYIQFFIRYLGNKGYVFLSTMDDRPWTVFFYLQLGHSQSSSKSITVTTVMCCVLGAKMQRMCCFSWLHIWVLVQHSSHFCDN
jgi:hypothetical protein